MINLLNKHQENKLNADVRVWNLIDCNSDKFGNLTAILDANVRLKTIIDAIRSKSSQKINAMKGKTEAKHVETEKIVKQIKLVAGSLNSLAIKEADPVTKEKVRANKKELERMRPEALTEKANTVLSLGTARLADLTAQGTGTTAQTLTDLKTEIDSYTKAVAAQGSGANEQSMATASIPELFRQGDVIIDDELEGLMEHVEETYPDLYAEFEKAKQINDLGTRHNPSTGSGQVPPAPATPPQNPPKS